MTVFKLFTVRDCCIFPGQFLNRLGGGLRHKYFLVKLIMGMTDLIKGTSIPPGPVFPDPLFPVDDGLGVSLLSEIVLELVPTAILSRLPLVLQTLAIMFTLVFAVRRRICKFTRLVIQNLFLLRLG